MLINGSIFYVNAKLAHYRPGHILDTWLRLQEFIENWHIKVVSLPDLRHRPPLSPEYIPGTHFC